MSAAAVAEQLEVQIMGAISMGAPAYNRGDVAECAKIYTATVSSLLRDPALPAQCQGTLQEALSDAGAQTDDADAQAWQLRHGMDAVLKQLRRSVTSTAVHSSQTTPTPVVLAYPVEAGSDSTPRPGLREAIQQAIATGVPMWNGGDYASCAAVYKAVAQEHSSSDPRLQHALRECVGAPLDSSQGSQGWIMRTAFDEILANGRAGRSYGGASSGREYTERSKATRISSPTVALGRASGRPLEWYVLNDTVMGGKSSSSLCEVAGGGLIFRGEINLDGGGFASCRTLIDSDETLGLGSSGAAHAIRLSVTGDGQMYKLGLRTSDGFREPTWQAEFLTRKGQRSSVTLPLNAETFHGSIMGRRVALPQDQAINWGAMRGVGFTLSLLDVHGQPSDRASFRAGPFELVVHSMELRIGTY